MYDNRYRFEIWNMNYRLGTSYRDQRKTNQTCDHCYYSQRAYMYLFAAGAVKDSYRQ